MDPAAAALRTPGRTSPVNAHQPVMLEEALAGLNVVPDGIYIDATFGRGGHSAAILERLGGSGALHALDQDPAACAHAFREFARCPNFRIHAANFERLGEIARAENIAGRVMGVLFDLGVSSPQLDDPARGFSFAKEGPLDMRMNPGAGESAAAWLARAGEQEIADVLWQYGEERDSRRIARAIVAARREAPIETTTRLAGVILAAHRGPRQKIHPATRSFQAIRIFINRELERLPAALQQAVEVLAPGGRLVAIAFHSLEDRIVKRFIRDAAAAEPKTLRKLGKRFPSPAEAEANPRARSAVLRIAERIA
ncbi:MAG: 16S rRNA (cytosine(1402)-N(4))-methyltransferase RsmH [Gammaproteobacteria bacterium]|nr:16S rRNA (cytosine(1402)-N(4))-methyltransferase RsmH [Gammaproteobacteria bacterium]